MARPPEGGWYDRRVNYLKLIINALWAGLYTTAIITLLLFFLNPELSARGVLSTSFLASFLSLGAVYVAVVAVMLPSMFICVRFFAARRLGTTWLNAKAIVWFMTVCLGGLTVAAYYNLRWTESLVAPAAHDALRTVCGTMAGCSLIGLCGASIAQLRPDAGRPLRVAAGFVLAVPPLLIMLLLPGAARHRLPGSAAPLGTLPVGMRPAAGSGRLLLIGLDGASMDYILPLASTRDLPTFAALMKNGASARLNSIIPCIPRVAWTSLLTGSPPWASGVKGVHTYALPAGADQIEVLPTALGFEHLVGWGYVSVATPPPDERRAPMLWEILRWSGHPVQVIGFGDAGSPRVAADESSSSEVDRRVLDLLGAHEGFLTEAEESRIAILKKALRADFAARAAALDLRRRMPEEDARMVAVRFPGLALVSRYFLAYHLPDEFGDVRQRERELFGRVIAGYYKILDDLLAEQIQLAGPDTFVIVASPHGVEPLSGFRRFVGLMMPGRHDDMPAASGTWRRGPDGILMVMGEGVIPDGRVDDADLVDVVPTALYALGLPIKANMRGDLLRRLFDRTFLETHPVHFIPAYGAPAPPVR